MRHDMRYTRKKGVWPQVGKARSRIYVVLHDSATPEVIEQVMANQRAGSGSRGDGKYHTAAHGDLFQRMSDWPETSMPG